MSRPQVLAIASQPAEAKPGEAVAYSALYAGPGKSPDASGLQWGFCTVQKPLALIDPVAPACLSPDAPDLVPLGSGPGVAGPSVLLPADACATFGPTPADPKPGTPPSRPTDPDTTGGYYQPVVVLVPTDAAPEYVVGVTRLDCGLGGATQQQAIDYAKRYRPNENPAVDTLVVTRASGDEEAVPGDAAAPPIALATSEHVTFTARWASCPTSPSCGDGLCTAGEDATSCAQDCTIAKGCTGSESYPLLDAESHALIDRRETIRISWFATDGQFTHDSTGRPAADAAESFSENDWVAPAHEALVQLWVVIRDDRGGTGWRAIQIAVKP